MLDLKEILKSRKLLKLLKSINDIGIENLSDLRDPNSWGCSQDDVQIEINKFIQNQEESMADKEIANFQKILKYDKLLKNAKRLEDSGVFIFSYEHDG